MSQENKIVKERVPAKSVLAGRAFKHAFDNELGGGDRAWLRRADDPQTVGAFWACFKAAQREYPGAYAPLYTAVVPLLDLLEQTDDDDLNVGRFLAKHHHKVALRRVEALFGADDFDELLDNLESLFILLKGSAIDYGCLLADLSAFDYSHESRAQLRQRWAASYFQNT